MKRHSVLFLFMVSALILGGCKKDVSVTSPQASLPPWDNGQSAEAVFGQSTLTGSGYRPADTSTINNPWGLCVDDKGTLFVVDQGAHRVLRFDNASSKASGAKADGELGQPDFLSTVWNYSSGGNTPSARGFETPTSVALDGSGNLYVVDQANGRVLRFNAASTKTNGAPADAVFGRPDFVSNGFGTTASSFFSPQSVAVDPSGSLYVADGSNNRVLRFDNAAAKASGASADGVLGQSDFVSSGRDTKAGRMANPISVAVDKHGNLYVGERGNCRILIFLAAASKPNGAAADIVLGKSVFTDGSTPAAASDSTIYIPYAMAVDQNDNLYVTDGSFYRVLVFYSAPAKKSGGRADAVLGKRNFTSASVTQAAPDNISQAFGVAVQSSAGALFASCYSNERVLRFRANSTLHP